MFLRPVTLLVSIVLGLISLAGVAWIIANGSITSVDGLFMSLILLTLSGIFFLNALWELRDLGLLGKSKQGAEKTPPVAKSD